MLAEILEKAGEITDILWNFPTNLDWYRNIPILGSLSFATLLLVGSGIYFTIRLRFVQIRHFGKGIRALAHRKASETGISPLASFLLSTAMRVGPGNILGVTGAITVGGPGALLWMWVSAFFGMATAYTESTLSQLFKEKKGNEYVGGMAFYGRRLLKNSAAAGVFLSALYIIYALLCFPAQGFNTLSAIGQIAETVSGSLSPLLYPISALIILLIVAAVSFGGIRRISKATTMLVPIMASIYILTTVTLILINADRIPWFFYEVIRGAFTPDAIFGGTFGMVLMQGIRRGLMSNEAGQGTMTMAAAASDASHPAEQGSIQSVGVFLDTMVICTLTGFIVVIASQYTDNAGKLALFTHSATSLAPTIDSVISIIISICFGLFAFTCLLGFVSFSEIAANRISKSKLFINFIRTLCLAVIAIGILTAIEGLDLSALWNLSDMANILLVFCNIPLLYLGFRKVLTCSKDYDSPTNK